MYLDVCWGSPSRIEHLQPAFKKEIIPARTPNCVHTCWGGKKKMSSARHGTLLGQHLPLSLAALTAFVTVSIQT